MTTRLTWITCLLFLGAAGAQGLAQTTYRLASAQVVTASERPPTLKLSASGPIAFELQTTDASGAPVGPNRLVARLYGVEPGELATLTGLEPFIVSVAPADHDAIVTIAVGGLLANQSLVLRAGLRTNEIEAAIVTAP